VEAPADVHLDDIEEEAEVEGLLEGAGQGGEEEGEEVTGRGAEEEEEPPKVRLEESAAREKGDKKEKKKKKRIRSQEEEEVGGTGFHKGLVRGPPLTSLIDLSSLVFIIFLRVVSMGGAGSVGSCPLWFSLVGLLFSKNCSRF
jgi:hypothetical protein